MDQALLKLIEEKRITPAAAYEKAAEKDQFAKLAKEAGTPIEHN
jgi:hypothetical protein